jgi:hypothetical protein
VRPACLVVDWGARPCTSAKSSMCSSGSLSPCFTPSVVQQACRHPYGSCQRQRQRGSLPHWLVHLFTASADGWRLGRAQRRSIPPHRINAQPAPRVSLSAGHITAAAQPRPPLPPHQHAVGRLTGFPPDLASCRSLSEAVSCSSGPASPAASRRRTSGRPRAIMPRSRSHSDLKAGEGACQRRCSMCDMLSTPWVPQDFWCSRTDTEHAHTHIFTPSILVQARAAVTVRAPPPAATWSGTTCRTCPSSRRPTCARARAGDSQRQTRAW